MIEILLFNFRLTLPDDLKATDIKWLSVWCRRFRVNFGDMFFPEDLSFEDNTLDVAVLPEGDHEHDHDHDEDESADAEGAKPEDLPPPLVGKSRGNISPEHEP